MPRMCDFLGATTIHAGHGTIPGCHRLGSLYDGDAVETDGRRSERAFPTTPPFMPGIQMDLGTDNTALAGDTLSMDLQVRPRP